MLSLNKKAKNVLKEFVEAWFDGAVLDDEMLSKALHDAVWFGTNTISFYVNDVCDGISSDKKKVEFHCYMTDVIEERFE